MVLNLGFTVWSLGKEGLGIRISGLAFREEFRGQSEAIVMVIPMFLIVVRMICEFLCANVASRPTPDPQCLYELKPEQ